MNVYSRILFLSGSVLVTSLLSANSAFCADSPTAEQVAFFEKSIRPVLVRECYSCHATTAQKIRGGLTLDTREGLRKGGDSGAVIVPGDAKKSLLIQALHHAEDVKPMPPKKQLADEVVADFEKWIAMGAPDPRDRATKVTRGEIDIESGRKFWAFQAPKKSTPPTVKDTAWPMSDIDRYLLAEMEAKGLKPSADADPRTLLRRLSFDLTGLPPTPEEIDAFVKAYAAKPQTAVEEAVDRLLASAQFGERWGRHWLDVARFAESSGRSNNIAYPHAWRYRDYVINSFNADKPYNQFIREQLAGDLLPTKDSQDKAEFQIATGFLAIGPKTHNERNPQQFQMDLADEQIDSTFQAFQGLTAACARCHDHKFDPIPQKDYYALAGIFRSTETCYGTIRVIQSNHPSPLINLPADSGVAIPLEPLTAARREAIEKQIKDLREEASKLTASDPIIRRIITQTRISTLQSQLTLYDSEGTPKPLAMGTRDRRFPADSPVYNRGELDQPGAKVRRGVPQVLTTKQPTIKDGSGRLELANWIASTDNPLTARVMANRVWLHLMGHGLVATPDNFGASGQPCSHPALLDHLAISFESDWSVKKLIRSVVLSHAYQLSSQFDPKNFEADPDDVLCWRMPRRRLEAEAMRDTMLAVAGKLELSPPKGSPVAKAGEGPIGPFRIQGDVTNDRHRTVYLPIVRDSMPELLTLFDFPDPSLIIGERAATTIPAQSLFLMNNPFVIRQAEALAEKVMALEGNDAARLTQAFQLCYSRPPTETERKNAEKFLADYGRKQSRRAAWITLCQGLFSASEFSYR